MRLAVLLLIVLFAADAMAAPPAKTIAITVDDLPWASLGGHPPTQPAPAILDHHRRLVAAVAATAGPVTGFVNGIKLEVDGVVVREREQMLRDWLAAGATLGNHTFGHVDLHAVGLAAYEADILRGDAPLRALLAETGQQPQWFRHPYLRAGRTAEDKAALAAFLGEHGYRIAPVTVDNSDWIWAAAYRNVLDGDADPATLARLRAGYVPYMLAKLDYYETFSIALLGHALPQVWLLHANEINAECWPALMAGLAERDYRIVGLDDALRDPAYARADAYTGAWGPSWLHRWAIGEQRPADFFAGEPVTPEWVLALAGVDSE
jgi:peptidoglycan/xylan/chitin deacetylase (PgdA/CDA1 family)